MEEMNQQLDPFGVGKATVDVWKAMIAEPEKLAESQKRFAEMWVDLWNRGAQRAAGETVGPVVSPEGGDRRFSNPAWTQNPALDTIKQAYLLVTEAFLAAIDATDVDPKTKRRAKFFAKQFCDMMSPSNLGWLNPDVIEATLRTGGQNLVDGMQHALEDAKDNEGRVPLVNTDAFELGKNVATTPGRVVFRNDLIELIRYDTTTETVYKRPLVIVPPWINKFYILDLQASNSFVRHATDAGFQTYVVSWRNPDASMAGVSMSDYVTQGALAACRAAAEVSGTRKVTVNGYCIGGTLVAMMLAYLAKKTPDKDDPKVEAATFMASLVDFTEPGEVANFLGADAIDYIEGKMNERGYLEGSEMADTFTMLRANDLIWTPAVNRYLLGKNAPAFDLLYWNNDSTRMPAAMHSYYLRHMYLENDLVKPGALEVDGVPIDLRKIEIPLYIAATREDHIAPWRSVYELTQIASGPVLFRLANSGHIAGVVNPPGAKKAQYYANDSNPRDSEKWLAKARRCAKARGGPTGRPGSRRTLRDARPRTASGDASRISEAAPGSYVLENEGAPRWGRYFFLRGLPARRFAGLGGSCRLGCGAGERFSQARLLARRLVLVNDPFGRGFVELPFDRVDRGPCASVALRFGLFEEEGSQGAFSTSRFRARRLSGLADPFDGGFDIRHVGQHTRRMGPGSNLMQGRAPHSSRTPKEGRPGPK